MGAVARFAVLPPDLFFWGVWFPGATLRGEAGVTVRFPSSQWQVSSSHDGSFRWESLPNSLAAMAAFGRKRTLKIMPMNDGFVPSCQPFLVIEDCTENRHSA